MPAQHDRPQSRRRHAALVVQELMQMTRWCRLGLKEFSRRRALGKYVADFLYSLANNISHGPASQHAHNQTYISTVFCISLARLDSAGMVDTMQRKAICYILYRYMLYFLTA